MNQSLRSRRSSYDQLSRSRAKKKHAGKTLPRSIGDKGRERSAGTCEIFMVTKVKKQSSFLILFCFSFKYVT